MLHVFHIHYLDTNLQPRSHTFDGTLAELPDLIRSVQWHTDVKTITNVEIEDLHGLSSNT